ncbi:MAG: NAD+ synthase [Candidatus Cloacimonetes bacterium]|nr:NAD+ synthase [Candidatus Cloacimonadota bacterium]
MAGEIDNIVAFIKKQLHDAGFEKIIVGLSGGVDSAVTAALSVRTVGRENVSALLLPYTHSSQDSLEDAAGLAQKLKIQYEIINISPVVDAYFDNYGKEADSLRRGNLMARVRMCVLYDFSAKYKALVAGTGNRSELLTGYCTQYGDSACAFEPLGHLYKTEVTALARALDIPAAIIKKPPTADLWLHQTDEDELGMSYAELDEILHQLVDLEKSAAEIQNSGIEPGRIERVVNLMKNSEFKRHLPPIPSLYENLQ